MPIPSVPPRRARRVRRSILAIAAAALLLPVAQPLAATAAPAAAPPPTTDLGPSVHVFTPDMAQATIQSQLDAIAKRQVPNQFGTERDAILFAPGTYGTAADPLTFQVGYYTEVAGLGSSPSDVVINGSVDVYNQCDASGCIALNNFWRSLSNLTIKPAGGSGCSADTEFWAVSQASPMRRVEVDGKFSLMDYCSAGPQYASGGFIADSVVTSTITSGSQQQFYTRNSSIGGWSNGVWNQVFSGVQGAPATAFPAAGKQYTTLATTPASREKPYLYLDAHGRYRVFVPAARTSSTGTSWQSGHERGRSIPLSRFFIARPGDSARTIDRALARGMDLLLTPGVYGIDRSLTVRRADTVVLGLGLATLTAERGAVPLRIADVPGVDVAGITVDAGATNSPALVQVGSGRRVRGAASDPTALQDVFFRIGGPHAGRATTSLVVNSDHVIVDDVWAWRADHGTGVGWTKNTAATGVVVNGDDVTATGLFVEHYQRYDVVWNGERGKTVFFQNELPYDAPDQAAWRHGSVLGWAAYKVSDRVRRHELWGGGSYIYTNVDPTLHASRAFEVPTRRGVVLHDVLTISLNKAGTIDHVVNGTGAPVTPDFQGPSSVARYPAS